jgi:hypothetical protein
MYTFLNLSLHSIFSAKEKGGSMPEPNHLGFPRDGPGSGAAST